MSIQRVFALETLEATIARMSAFIVVRAKVSITIVRTFESLFTAWVTAFVRTVFDVDKDQWRSAADPRRAARDSSGTGSR